MVLQISPYLAHPGGGVLGTGGNQKGGNGGGEN
jgi:hypothetical protein